MLSDNEFSTTKAFIINEIKSMGSRDDYLRLSKKYNAMGVKNQLVNIIYPYLNSDVLSVLDAENTFSGKLEILNNITLDSYFASEVKNAEFMYLKCRLFDDLVNRDFMLDNSWLAKQRFAPLARTFYKIWQFFDTLEPGTLTFKKGRKPLELAKDTSNVISMHTYDLKIRSKTCIASIYRLKDTLKASNKIK